MTVHQVRLDQNRLEYGKSYLGRSLK
jgi:hypothetical protein